MAQNDFISYLNSLHSLNASGSNALAESQAYNPFFLELYTPLSIVNDLYKLLMDGKDKVVILTGHAGDGKSTVAVDILRKIKGIPEDVVLSEPLSEIEPIDKHRVTIVKDMSELSSEKRVNWLSCSFSTPGSWLIVSNTGPLLDSFTMYADENGYLNVESRLLELLDQSLGVNSVEEHTLDDFSKQLFVINLTCVDNIETGSILLKKLIQHSGWDTCRGCTSREQCLIYKNLRALESDVGTVTCRVRWLYQKLNAYEQRLTLRQILAQLAFSITGGKTCDHAYNGVEIDEDHIVGMFSENFFGFQNGSRWPIAERLRAISLLKSEEYGAPLAVNFERELISDSGLKCMSLPPDLEKLAKSWSLKAKAQHGSQWRYALRRLFYFFGSVEESQQKQADNFFDLFLHSPCLRSYDKWRQYNRLTLKRREQSILKKSCLKVLLEIFSGFCANQFAEEKVYITLRRPDEAVVQPTQIVLRSIPFKDFDLTYSENAKLPALKHLESGVELKMSLPLLDYICLRNSGQIGSSLSPVLQNQINRFKSRLLNKAPTDNEEIELLRAGIGGDISSYYIYVDEDNKILEIY